MTTAPRKKKTTPAVSHRMALVQSFKAQLLNPNRQQHPRKW
jgi:hypothetical protein